MRGTDENIEIPNTLNLTGCTDIMRPSWHSCIECLTALTVSATVVGSTPHGRKNYFYFLTLVPRRNAALSFATQYTYFHLENDSESGERIVLIIHFLCLVKKKTEIIKKQKTKIFQI